MIDVWLSGIQVKEEDIYTIFKQAYDQAFGVNVCFEWGVWLFWAVLLFIGWDRTPRN